MNKEQILLFGNFFLIAVLFGVSFNFAVMINNQGKMPVLQEGNYSDSHHFSYLNNSEINYPYLSDIIPLFNYFWSIGDLIVLIGVTGFVLFSIIYIKVNLKEVKNGIRKSRQRKR